MALNEFTDIEQKEITSMGVQALADRPNKVSQYGQSGLSAIQLKKWFDNLADLLRKKINEDHAIFSSAEATKFIAYLESIKPEDLKSIEKEADIKSLADLIISMRNGIFASEVLEVNSTLNSTPKPLTWCINTIDQILARKAEFQGPKNNILIVSDEPIDYAYDENGDELYECDKDGTLKYDENGKLIPVTTFNPQSAINTNFADKRYGRKIAAEYNNQNGSLKICLQSLQNDEDDNEKNDKKETISECAVHLPLVKTTSIPDRLYGTDSNGEQKEYPVSRFTKKIELSYSNVDGNLTVTLKNEDGETLSSDSINIPVESTVVKIDEYEVDGTAYLKLELRNGNYVEVALDDVVKGFAKQTDVETKLSKSETPETVYGVGPDGSQMQLPIVRGDDSISDWNTRLVSKQYAWLRNSDRGDSVSPTAEQVDAGTAVGWYRIAKRSITSDGTGGCNNIFKVLCYGTGKGESSLIFSVNMAEYNTVPAICVLSNSYRLGTGLDTPPITKVRVSRGSGKEGEAYVEVYLNVSPALTLGKTCVRFKTETLLYDDHRRWILMKPTFTTESYNVTEKSVIDYSWSDVIVSTSYLNELPEKIEEIEDRINSLHPVVEYISMMPYIEAGDRENVLLLFKKGKKFHFNGNYRIKELEDSNIYPASPFAAVNFDWEFTPDTPGSISIGNTVSGAVSNFTATLDYDGYTLVSADASRMAFRYVHGQFVVKYMQFTCTLDLTVRIKDSAGTEYSCDIGHVYLVYNENGNTEGCLSLIESYIEKTSETAHFFPSTYDFRTQSIDRRLAASLEENIARIAEEFENKYNGEE